MSLEKQGRWPGRGLGRALALAAGLGLASAMMIAPVTVASGASSLQPLVLSASATPAALGPSGGEVEVTGRVQNATVCQLVLLSRQPFPVVYSHNPTTACQSGQFSARVTVGANPTQLKRTVAFALVASNGVLSFTGRFYVSVAPLLQPLVLSARATPAVLGPSGGQVEVTGRVLNARLCQLVLLSHQSFPVAYSHNPTPSCRGGQFSARVTIGANPTQVERTVAFALVAFDGSLSFTGRFYVLLALNPHPQPPPPPPRPPLPTRYPKGTSGYDVSWPQCATRGSAATKPLPADPAFAIVGVNDGTISGFNSCFAAEAAWAGPNLSVYIILQPVPSGAPASNEMTGPRASCAASDSACRAYNWGYNYTQADLAYVRAQGSQPNIWWLDVETAEGWGTSSALKPLNAAVIQGALDALRGAGKVAGVYCTWYQWGEITGSYLPPVEVPVWVAGAISLSGGYLSAQSYCQRALSPGDPSTLQSAYIGFAGGAPWLAQYPYPPGALPVDHDYACG